MAAARGPRPELVGRRADQRSAGAERAL